MKTVKIAFLLLIALALTANTVHAQSQPTRTTLSTALGTPSVANNQMVVASASGINASTASLQSLCLIEEEFVQVQAISGTTLSIKRNVRGYGTGHPSGATVICGYYGSFNPGTGTISTIVGSPSVGASVNGATFVSALPVGACTRSSNAILPVFLVSGTNLGMGGSYGYTVDCLGGKWVSGTMPEVGNAIPLVLACNVPVGSVAYASFGTSTTDIAGQEWDTSIMVDRTGYITGIQVLAGGTATTDNILGILRDSAGNLLANSATAGQVLSGANTFQTLAFTAPRLVVGPARYFIGVQGNGTAAGSIRTVAASTFPNVVTSVVAGTFGTVTSTLSVPSTFTADKGPVSCLYY